GYSDHSGDIFACLAAAALGAEILEFHIVFDKKMFGPDAKASLTVAQTKQLVQGVRQIETALNMPVIKDDNKQYEPLKIMFGKTLAVNKNLEAGHLITFEDLESKKPAGQGLSTNAFTFVIGKKLNRAKKANEFLTEEDVK